jgi:transaldolase
MATNRLHEIEAQGTAIWIDTLSRELLDEGTLERLIADDGVTGVTSNPTIFKKAMEDSERYDRHLREAIAETSDPRQVYFRVAFADTRDACDLLRPVFERTEGRDGYVSSCHLTSPTTSRARSTPPPGAAMRSAVRTS